MVSEETKDSTLRILDTLNPLESAILRKSFGLGETKLSDDAAIGKVLRIPEEMVDIYRSAALRRLRDPSRVGDLSRLAEIQSSEETAHRELQIASRPGVKEIENLTPDLLEHLQRKSDDIRNLNPIVFEQLVAELLASRDFRDVQLIGRRSDSAADIFAAKYVNDIGVHRYFVEVKRWKEKVGVEVIDRVYGAKIGERPQFGWTAALVVSLVGFKRFKKYSVNDQSGNLSERSG